MKLQNQVSSLELSRRLFKYLNWKDCLWCYARTNLNERYRLMASSYITEEYDDTIPAFTVAELGEMLPESIRIKKQFRMLTLLKKDTINEKTRQKEIVYGYYYYDCVDGKGCKDQTPKIPEYDVNEANARAKMLIYLIENKLVDVKSLTK